MHRESSKRKRSQDSEEENEERKQCPSRSQVVFDDDFFPDALPQDIYWAPSQADRGCVDQFDQYEATEPSQFVPVTSRRPRGWEDVAGMPYTASRSYTPSLCSDASHSGPRHNRTPVLDESEPKYLPPRFPHDTRYSDDSSSQPMLNSSFQCADEYNDLDARIEYADGSHRLDARMRYDDDYYVKDFDEASTPSQHDPSYRNDVHVRRENGQWDTRNGHDLYHQPDRESGSFDANELSYPARYDCTTSHPTNDGYSGLEDFRTGTPVTIGSQNLLSMSPPSRSRPQPRWRAEGARTELRDYSRRDRSTAPPDHVAAQTEPYARYTGEDHPSPRYDDSPRSTTHDLCHSSIPKPPRKQRPASHSPSPGIAPDPLEMLSLRNIVMIPEAKINPYKKREIGPGENAKAIFDFFIEDKGRVPTPELPIVQRRRSPLFVPAENEVTEPKVDWRKDKSIRNPKWFTGATSPVSEDAATARGCLPVVVGGPVIQKRHLYRSLEAFGLEMVECEGHVQSTDLVLSPKTAIIFHNLATLADGRDLLLHRVKRAAVYFERTIIILEVISYRLLASKTDADIETNPLTPELVKSLGALKRALAVSIQPGQDEMIGTAELIFAVNGSDEVAGAIRHLAEQDNLRISARCNTLVREVWDRKQWIQQESMLEDEECLVGAGFNVFSTRFILSLVDTYAFFAEHLSANERKDLVEAVVGVSIIDRFNKLYEAGAGQQGSPNPN